MSGFVEVRFMRFVLLAASFIVIPAFAQFEIAPDHFDGSEQKPATHKSTLTKKAKSAPTAAHRPATHAVVASAAAPRAKRTGSVRTQQMAHQLKPNEAGNAR